MSLSRRQQRFVDEYLLDLNATQAAIRAGYSAATARFQASRLLTSVNVVSAIDAKMKARSAQASVTAEEVLRGLKTEATLTGEGCSHSARVQAWTQLGKHLGLFVDRTQLEGLLILELAEEIVDAGCDAPHHKNGQAPPGTARLPHQ